MNYALVFVVSVLGYASAAPPREGPVPVSHPHHHEVVPIISHEAEVHHDGSFHYSYESADGSKAEEHGELKQFDEEHAGEVVEGSFEYKGDDGKLYRVTYTADENGFHPEGEHLPVAPPVPPQIARALEYLRSVTNEEE